MTDSLFEQYKAALRRGHLAAIDGRLEEALDAYRAAGRLVPGRSLPLASQGTVLHRLGRWDEAAAAFDGALRLAPDDEAALRARATARDERGERSGAAADYERLAFVLDVAGRAQEAAAAARRAAELEPNAARTALADRLGTAAQVAGGTSVRAPAVPEPAVPEPARMESDAGGAAAEPDPSAARRSEAAGATDEDEVDVEAEAAWAAVAERFARDRIEEDASLAREPIVAEDAPFEREPIDEDAPLALSSTETTPAAGAGDAFDLDAARAALADGAGAAGDPEPEPVEGEDPASFPGLELEPEPSDALETAVAETAAPAPEAAAGEEAEEDRHDWPPVDLPSLPPPLEGPAPDPEQLLVLATAAVEAHDLTGARDLLLTAVLVHRQEGRLDAALEVCLDLLEIAPGDPQVHIAIANLQLDRGWTELAREKIELLLRLTSLTGDTQAEADVHYLASERLRDEPVGSRAAR